eukprot:7217241-Pyramimonas_sp.AAC.1
MRAQLLLRRLNVVTKSWVFYKEESANLRRSCQDLRHRNATNDRVHAAGYHLLLIRFGKYRGLFTRKERTVTLAVDGVQSS